MGRVYDDQAECDECGDELTEDSEFESGVCAPCLPDRLATDLARVQAEADADHATLMAIRDRLSGREWDGEEAGDISSILVTAGFALLDSSGRVRN